MKEKSRKLKNKAKWEVGGGEMERGRDGEEERDEKKYRMR